MLVRPKTCKSGQPTQDGSKYSNTKLANSSTGPTVKFLVLEMKRMKKVKLLVSRITTEVLDKLGMYFILTRLERLRLRV